MNTIALQTNPIKKVPLMRAPNERPIQFNYSRLEVNQSLFCLPARGLDILGRLPGPGLVGVAPPLPGDIRPRPKLFRASLSAFC